MTKDKFIIVIGTSAGGSVVLPDLLKQLTKEMNVAVFLVMHISKHSVGDMLVKRMQKYTLLTCKMAEHGETIKTNYVYIARPDHHLMMSKNKIFVGSGPMENRYRPSIDALFRSAAAAYDHRVIGIILTGMLEDGASGMFAIRRSGGTCIIQDPSEAQYPDMPNAVLNILHPDYSVPVIKMGEAILETIRSNKKPKTKIPPDILKEAEIAERVNISIDDMAGLGEHSMYSCPDCGGGLWEIAENGETRYRCHVGHAFTSEGLLANMEASTESALWTALRIIEERRNLLKKLSDKEKQKGSRKAALAYQRRSIELEAQIQHLKKTLFSLQRDEPARNVNGKSD
jgi:two-component system chemotaxis response regulator CheB